MAEDPEAPIEDSAWAVKTELGAALHLSNRSVELLFDLALGLERAGQVIEGAEYLTASQLRVRVQRLCYLANPADARLRYGEAVKNRCVSV